MKRNIAQLDFKSGGQQTFVNILPYSAKPFQGLFPVKYLPVSEPDTYDPGKVYPAFALKQRQNLSPSCCADSVCG